MGPDSQHHAPPPVTRQLLQTVRVTPTVASTVRQPNYHCFAQLPTLKTQVVTFSQPSVRLQQTFAKPHSVQKGARCSFTPNFSRGLP